MIEYQIKFAHHSLVDFNEGLTYYDKISNELGDKFHTHFWNQIEKVKTSPLHYQQRYKSIRIAFIDSFHSGSTLLLKKTKS